MFDSTVSATALVVVVVALLDDEDEIAEMLDLEGLVVVGDTLLDDDEEMVEKILDVDGIEAETLEIDDDVVIVTFVIVYLT